MTERFDKGIEFTNFWDYALGEPPFTEKDIEEFRMFLEENAGSMPLDNPQQPEPAIFVADIDFDDDLPF
jgi:hypothetical protein